ncbi:unnamed protein product [Ceratitis capitata]|uniref:(Mediterranean fruit fly) hypothetical protein n=1 Tax=Ceratitis capitata TaxID=7213 RepID=A0A811V371_CERCA|nr:unnamed protein product [Ceratitis capitata]
MRAHFIPEMSFECAIEQDVGLMGVFYGFDLYSLLATRCWYCFLPLTAAHHLHGFPSEELCKSLALFTLTNMINLMLDLQLIFCLKDI